MPVQWSSETNGPGETNGSRTSSSRDLLLDVRGGSAALADALRTAVRTGRLASGAELPSTRALAADLGIARGTVTSAFGQLAAEGYLLLRQGAPARVADVERIRPAVTLPPAAPAGPHPGWAVRHNLMPGLPDTSAFPRDVWLSATRRVLASTPHEALGYSDPMGHPALRSSLAAYLGRTRGVLADPDRVVVGPGFSALLGLWSATLLDRGVTTVAFEDPSLPNLRRAATGAGLRIRAVPVDQDGVRVDLLDAPAAVLTPAHQFPLGVTLAPDRRAALARRATAEDLHVLEDDYDGEFRFDRQPVGAVQALAPSQVTYGGTASKALAPAMRMAWLVVPARLVAGLRDRSASTGATVPVLDQLVLADLLDSGAYDRHVRRMRSRYRARRDALVRAVAPLGLVPTGIAAGLHLLLRTGDGGERAVAAAARRHGVGVDLLGRYRIEHPQPDGVLVGYAAPAEHAFSPALDALTTVLTGLR